ncbi:M24 family metallopeptidase [Brevibacillus reuszeri]|uniref:M24 family metallopeptidase n=1 Tax=Brevibacillus reuszeri TaxID=54915 RepID=UPI003D199E0B
MSRSRLENIREVIRQRNVDALFIQGANNVQYFSGFTGSNGYLLITTTTAVLITDQRYTEQAKQEATGWTILIHGLDPFTTITMAIKPLGITRIAYESKETTDYQITELRQEIPFVEWVPCVDVCIQLRAVKDADEATWIQTALQMAEAALGDLCEVIRPGVSEREIAVELEMMMRKRGSEGPAFDTIVASGPNSALPHAKPTERAIQHGDLIVIDFGATYKGYRSDVTRTIIVGELVSEQQQLFDCVHLALEQAVAGIKPGAICHELDKLARDVFIQADLEAYSLRGLGHGVGLDIHEYPRVVMNNQTMIEPGMLFTVEPGLYVPGFGGVRIEDMVLVTEEGCQVLTRTPRVMRL